MNLEEILEFLEESDDDVEQIHTKQPKELDKNQPLTKDVDYNEIYNELIRDSSSNDSDSLEFQDSSPPNNLSNIEKITSKTDDSSSLFNEEQFSGGFVSEMPLENSISSLSSNVLDNKISSKFDTDFDLSDSVNIATDSKNSPTGILKEDGKICQCGLNTKLLIANSSKGCGDSYNSVKHCVEMQLSEWDYKHKLHLLHKLKEYRNRITNKQEETDNTHTSGSDENESTETLRPNISKNYLKTLCLPSSTFVEDLNSNKLSIRLRHKLTNSLELLKIFDDRFYSIDESSIHRLTKSSTNILTPTCICTSSDLVLFGTMCGSVFISEFSMYNYERKFCSYNEYDALDPTIDPLNWYEIDSEKGISVTSLDILPNTGWITVGYSDGTVKLLQNFKVTRSSKGYSSTKGEYGDYKGTDNRTFGYMADAVSSAFSGMKKTSSQTLCSTDVFNDSVLNCKFTFAESYEEIICSNLRSIAILTYSKNVLSHNLNVNYLQSLNERLENDQIVDIVCLSSNPQAKFITGGNVGGICAILTFKTCLIFSTRPRLSILINVTLDKLNKNLSPDFSQVPCVTWMIFNSGKKSIKPLLLISLGNQIRFIQCNLQTVKGALTMNVSNMGTIQFKHTIRTIRIITRLILAIVDYNNFLHIVQINLTSTPMYYDVIRTMDLNEFSNKMELGIDVFDPLWLIQTSLLSTISVYPKTVKMVAKGYKKFSNLVSDLFQGKKHTSSFDLKNFSILILVPNGVVGIEINSWVKVIGELSASKMFCEALSIIHALSEEWIPGLYDFKAFKNNLSQLVLYILHQSSAHIIKLSKFVNETQNISTNLLNLDTEAPKDDFWNTKVKSDVYDQINTLCCSMIDSCVSAKLYEPLNDLIFRCFATINLEHVFVKYILLNFHNDRISLQFLNSQIIESICQTYEMVLDNMYANFLEEQYYVEDEILYINQIVNTNYSDGKKSLSSSNSYSDNLNTKEDNMENGYKDKENTQNNLKFQDKEIIERENICSLIMSFVENLGNRDMGYLFDNFKFDYRLLVYHIICNNLCKIQLYCFKNNVITDTNKAVSRLSRHFAWHCLIYCQSVVLDDYSNLLNVILLHAYNKYMEIRNRLNNPTLCPNKEETESELVEESPEKMVDTPINKLSTPEQSDTEISDEEKIEELDKQENEYVELDTAKVDDEYLGKQDRVLEKENDEDYNPDKINTKHNNNAPVNKDYLILPLNISENLFAVRVLFLTLESFLTFENCGLTDTIDTGTYCNLISYLSSTESFKPIFPIEAKSFYARDALLYDLVVLDYEKISTQKFPHDFKNPESTVIFKLLSISPRLFFVCLSNLFRNCSDKFSVHSNFIGTKISTFNFLMNVVVSSLYKLEECFGAENARIIKDLASLLFLTVASTSEHFHMSLNTSFLAIYSLLTSEEHLVDLNNDFRVDREYSKELIHPEGYFNNSYFYDVFYRKDTIFKQESLMEVSSECVERVISTYLKKLIYSICSKLNSVSELGQNSHFVQLVQMCDEFIPLTSGSLRLFFYQITGDFNGIVVEYESFNKPEDIFVYFDKCIEYIRLQSKQLPENVEHLLLMDSTIRKNFVRAIMKNLPMLIKLNLNKVTNLLIQVFSLMDIIKALDSNLETSPEAILNTLEKLPDLQLLVLDALLKSKSNSGNLLQLPNSYFNRYLNLLSIHDKSNVANFLKRQKSLNITYCLKICKQNNIEDAVIYLLLRAGNLEEAVHLLLVSFSNNIKVDLKMCSGLIKTAHTICQEYHNQISYEIIEKMWFTMLKVSIESLNLVSDENISNGNHKLNGYNNLENGVEDNLEKCGSVNQEEVSENDETNQYLNNTIDYTSFYTDNVSDGNNKDIKKEKQNIQNNLEFQDKEDQEYYDQKEYNNELRLLVEEIFTVGILKYVKFPSALMEIIKYDANLNLFKNPLHNLLSDFQLQTYISNSASTISKIIMNKEFRSRQIFNNRGVVISTINRNAMINRNLVCSVCNKNLVYNLHLDPEIIVRNEKHGRKTKQHHLEQESKISSFEEQIGFITQVPIQGDKTNTTSDIKQEGSYLLNNIYNDRLSTFVNRKNKSTKSFNQTHNIGLYPPIIQTIARDLDSFRREPIIVYWCRHSFHQQCAPESCPICNIDE